jgi:hypothetical protein
MGVNPDRKFPLPCVLLWIVMKAKEVNPDRKSGGRDPKAVNVVKFLHLLASPVALFDFHMYGLSLSFGVN